MFNEHQKIVESESASLRWREFKGLYIKDAHERIIAGFKLRNETIVALFRVGHSDPPSACSLRLHVERVVKID